MSPHHHVPRELLVDYAAGAMPSAVSLAVAAHLTFCASCRAESEALDAVGGALLADLEGEPVGADEVARVLERASREGEPAGTAPPAVPEAVRRALAGDFAAVAWRRITSSLDELRFPAPEGFRSSLMRIQGGARMPRHTHDGHEYTVVLSGGFSDASGRYGRGDFVAADGARDHAPAADAGEPCICLAVLDSRLRFTGRFGRLLNPFVKF